MLILISITVLFFHNTYGQKNKPEYSVLLIPDSLMQKANTVIRNYEIHVETNGNKSYKCTKRKVVTILSENSGQRYWAEYYDPNKKIKSIDIVLFDAFGNQIRKVKKEEFEDKSRINDFSIYEDNRMQFVDLTHSEYPYTIEINTEVTEKDFLIYPIPVFQPGNRTSIEQGVLTIDVPKDFELVTNIIGEVEYNYSASGDRTKHLWYVENRTSHLNKSNWNYTQDETFPLVMVQPKHFILGDVEGSYSSWKEFGLALFKLNEGRDDISPQQEDIIQSIVDQSSDRREIISRLYKYLQETTRYVSVQLGIGGMQTYPASYVEEYLYGDCKALSNYMKGMLKTAGIDAYLTWASAGSMNQMFSDDFPSQMAFDHAILYIPEEDMYLECTMGQYPPGYVGRRNHNKKVLCLTQNGGELKTIPQPTAEENRVESTTDIHLTFDGNAILHHRVKALNETQEAYREMSEMNISEVKEIIQEYSELPTFEFKSFKIDADPNQPSASLEMELDVNKLGVKTGPRMFVPINPINPYKNQAQAKKIQFLLETKTGKSNLNEYIFEIPDGYAIENAPKSVELVHQNYGHLKIDIKQDGQKLIVKKDMLIPKYSVTPDEYPEYRKFLKKWEKADNGKFVLVANKP